MNYQLRYLTDQEFRDYVLQNNKRFLQMQLTDLVWLTGYKENEHSLCFTNNTKKDYAYFDFQDKKIHYSADTAPSAFVRPVLAMEGMNIEADTIEMGYYPQWLASRERTYELEDKYLSNSLETTGLSFVLYDVKYIEERDRYQFHRYPVYVFDDHLYIRYIIPGKLINSIKVEIRDRHFLDGDPAWVEVTPVEWLVDHDKSLLVSRYCLVDRVPSFNSDIFLTFGMREDMFRVNLISEEKLQKQPLKETALSKDIQYVKEQLRLSRGIALEATPFLDNALERLDIISDKVNTAYQKVKK